MLNEMKNLLLIALAVVWMSSCKKDIRSGNPHPSYLENVKTVLKDSLSSGDYANLEFKKSIITKAEDGRNLLRVPFNGKKLAEEFVLLKTDSLGQVLKGLIVSLTQRSPTNETKYVYNGTIKISYLNRKDKWLYYSFPPTLVITKIF